MKLYRVLEITNSMKLYNGTLFFFSVALSAQISLRKPLNADSIKFPKIEKSAVILPTPTDSKIDSTIAKLYRMPVAKPKNPELYLSLKAPKIDTALYKTPNLLNVAKRPKLAAK
jgi:hypothetical protein